MDSSFWALPVVRRTLGIATESAMIVAAFVTAVAVRFSIELSQVTQYELLVAKALLVTFVLELCFHYTDLYVDRVIRRRLEFILRLAQALIAAALLLSLIYYGVPELMVGRGILLIFGPLVVLAVISRRAIYLWTFGNETLGDKVLILGTGQTAQQIAIEMLKRAPLGYLTTGFLGEHPAEVGRKLVNPSVIGTIDELDQIVDSNGVTLIVVAQEDRRGKLPVSDLVRCRLSGVRVEDAPNFYERLTGKILLSNLRPSWLVFSRGFNKPRLLRNSKRIIDFSLALAVLALTAPILALLAIFIKLDSPGPVFYRQERVSVKGKTFYLIKLRTMRVNAEASTGPVWATSKGDPRITRVGRWLRMSRLDELPQIINVLRGEMSFVGPRPERPHFVEQLRKIIPYYDERHTVRPGITGWAQVKFRYGATIEDTEEKLQFDLYYIKHMSLIFDLTIIIDTFKVMLVGRGAR